jgi:hypothetical protein
MRKSRLQKRKLITSDALGTQSEDTTVKLRLCVMQIAVAVTRTLYVGGSNPGASGVLVDPPPQAGTNKIMPFTHSACAKFMRGAAWPSAACFSWKFNRLICGLESSVHVP